MAEEVVGLSQTKASSPRQEADCKGEGKQGESHGHQKDQQKWKGYCVSRQQVSVKLYIIYNYYLYHIIQRAIPI